MLKGEMINTGKREKEAVQQKGPGSNCAAHRSHLGSHHLLLMLALAHDNFAGMKCRLWCWDFLNPRGDSNLQKVLGNFIVLCTFLVEGNTPEMHSVHPQAPPANPAGKLPAALGAGTTIPLGLLCPPWASRVIWREKVGRP